MTEPIIFFPRCDFISVVWDAHKHDARIPHILILPLSKANRSRLLPANHDLPISLSHPIEKFIWTGRSGGVGSVARCGSGPGVPWRQCAEISHSASKGKNDTAARAWHNCLFVSGDVRINRGCFESWSVEMDRLWSTAMQSSELPVPLSRHRGEVM